METATLNAFSSVATPWITTVQQSWQSDPNLQQLIADLKVDASLHIWFLWDHGVFTYKGSLVVENSTDHRAKIIVEYHSTSVGEHAGIDKTTRRIREFYWKELQKDMHKFISECDVCQRFKGEHVHVPRLLQPLPIREKIWTDVSMDFIEGLPKSQGKTTIFVVDLVVDRLTKYAHFISLLHPLHCQGC